jgi:hypothetical protein
MKESFNAGRPIDFQVLESILQRICSACLPKYCV